MTIDNEIEKLKESLDSATSNLSSIESKKMFGCHAAWVKGNVFALVWKKGRLGVKLPDESSYQKLMKEKGAEPWKIGPKTMSHWVFLPKNYHKNKRAINKWVKEAYSLCENFKPKKKVSSTKKKTEKKVVKRKKVSR